MQPTAMKPVSTATTSSIVAARSAGGTSTACQVPAPRDGPGVGPCVAGAVDCGAAGEAEGPIVEPSVAQPAGDSESSAMTARETTGRRRACMRVGRVSAAVVTRAHTEPGTLAFLGPVVASCRATSPTAPDLITRAALAPPGAGPDHLTTQGIAVSLAVL
jgi:hypothetical protein